MLYRLKRGVRNQCARDLAFNSNKKYVFYNKLCLLWIHVYYMWWYRTVCLSCSSNSLRLLFLFLILLVSFLAWLLTWLDLTLPLSILLCALEKISVSQMLPDAAGLYHLGKAWFYKCCIDYRRVQATNARRRPGPATNLALVTVTKICLLYKIMSSVITCIIYMMISHCLSQL